MARTRKAATPARGRAATKKTGRKAATPARGKAAKGGAGSAS